MIVLTGSLIMIIIWLSIIAIAQAPLEKLVGNFIASGKANFSFYFTFENLTTDLLVYLALLYTIY